MPVVGMYAAASTTADFADSLLERAISLTEIAFTAVLNKSLLSLLVFGKALGRSPFHGVYDPCR